MVCGAVLRGIEGAITTERRCRRHYGYVESRLYSPQKYPSYDKTKRRVIKSHYSGDYALTGFLAWFVAKVSNFVAHDFYVTKYSTNRMMSFKPTGAFPNL